MEILIYFKVKNFNKGQKSSVNEMFARIPMCPFVPNVAMSYNFIFRNPLF